MKAKVIGKAVLAIAASACLAFALAGCGGGGGTGDAGKSSELRFVTGGESGTYYAFGSVIANHATNNIGTTVTALSSGGSAANIADLQDGNAELAFCQADVATYAFEGSDQWKELGDGNKVDCYSTVAYLYDEQVQIVTCDPDIKTVEDLKGKNVSIGAAGSGVYFNAIDILGAYGLSESDIKPTYESFADTANSIKDGKIDAGFVVAGAPTTAVTDLSTSKDTYLIGLDEEHISKLLEASPYYTKATIPADTYKGQDKDIQTLAVGAVILARDDVSADTVKAFTADIFDNYESLTDSHAKYSELSLEKATSITSVPYHAGAAAYFSEKGITVPTK